MKFQNIRTFFIFMFLYKLTGLSHSSVVLCEVGSEILATPLEFISGQIKNTILTSEISYKVHLHLRLVLCKVGSRFWGPSSWLSWWVLTLPPGYLRPSSEPLEVAPMSSKGSEPDWFSVCQVLCIHKYLPAVQRHFDGQIFTYDLVTLTLEFPRVHFTEHLRHRTLYSTEIFYKRLFMASSFKQLEERVFLTLFSSANVIAEHLHLASLGPLFCPLRELLFFW